MPTQEVYATVMARQPYGEVGNNTLIRVAKVPPSVVLDNANIAGPELYNPNLALSDVFYYDADIPYFLDVKRSSLRLARHPSLRVGLNKISTQHSNKPPILFITCTTLTFR